MVENGHEAAKIKYVPPTKRNMENSTDNPTVALQNKGKECGFAKHPRAFHNICDTYEGRIFLENRLHLTEADAKVLRLQTWRFESSLFLDLPCPNGARYRIPIEWNEKFVWNGHKLVDGNEMGVYCPMCVEKITPNDVLWVVDNPLDLFTLYALGYKYAISANLIPGKVDVRYLLPETIKIFSDKVKGFIFFPRINRMCDLLMHWLSGESQLQSNSYRSANEYIYDCEPCEAFLHLKNKGSINALYNASPKYAQEAVDRINELFLADISKPMDRDAIRWILDSSTTEEVPSLFEL